MRPKIFPIGKLRQKGAVGWSMSGVMPPIRLAIRAIVRVLSEIDSGPANTNITPSAVKDARSWVLPVISISVIQELSMSTYFVLKQE